MVSLVLVLSTVQGDKCKQFVCSDFDKTTNDICVKLDTAPASKQKVRECEANKVCSGIIWWTTDDAWVDATCVAIPDPAEIVNMIVPGDACKEAKECYGDDDKKKCESGVCTTTVKIGDDCSAGYRNHDLCPVGSYCYLSANKCIAQKKYGEACANMYDCPTGLACHDGARKGTFICDKWWSVEAGKSVDSSKVRPGGYSGFLLAADLCKTRYSIATVAPAVGIQCRVAHISADQTEAALKRPDGPKANDCKFKTQDDPADPTKVTDATGNSYCGFNKDDAAYCGKRKGDPDFKAALAKVQSLPFDSVNCHVHTGLLTCPAAIKVLTMEIYNQFSKALMSTVESGGRWANYANNAKCVKKSITLAFWGMDSAVSSFSMVSLETKELPISA
jgi:hypothetical protein